MGRKNTGKSPAAPASSCPCPNLFAGNPLRRCGHHRGEQSCGHDRAPPEPVTPPARWSTLACRGQALSQTGGALRPGIVHRLDKDTSGVILVAKTDAAHARLGEAFRQRTVNKTYIALVQGSFEQTSGRIELAIGRDPVRRVRMAAEQKKWHGAKIGNPRPGANRLARFTAHRRHHPVGSPAAHRPHPPDTRTLVRAETSRSWVTRFNGAAAQLRVGDVTLPPLGRNFLHAAKIIFSHPRTGERMELRAPLPTELKEFLSTLATPAEVAPGKIDAALAGYLLIGVHAT